MTQPKTEDELAFDLIDRLHKSLRVSGHDAETLAPLMGIHANTIRNYLSGRTHPSRPVLLAWAFAVGHGVSREWLETGEGTAPNPSPPGQTAGPAERLASLAAAKKGRRVGAPPTHRYPVAA